MAVSTCLKCAGHSFELAMFAPMGGAINSRSFSVLAAERRLVSWTLIRSSDG